MKKFILMIDSLIKTFSIIEAGKDVTFTYENKDGIEAFESVSKGDMILGYFAEPIKQIKCVFEVQEIPDAPRGPHRDSPGRAVHAPRSGAYAD